MASILKVDDLRGNTAAGNITITSEGGAATMQLQQGIGKAWVNFTQISTQTVRDSLNISSITDAATGRTYPISYTNSMNNGDYTGSWFTSCSTNLDYTYLDNQYAGGFGSRITASCGVRSYGSSGDVDSIACDLIIHGDLA
jgi:hypothetical protein